MIDDFLTAADDLPEHVLDSPRLPSRPAAAGSAAPKSSAAESSSATTMPTLSAPPAVSTNLFIEDANERSTLADLVDAATSASDNLPAVQVSMTAIAAGILLAASVVQSRTAPQTLVLSVSHPWTLEVSANRGVR